MLSKVIKTKSQSRAMRQKTATETRTPDEERACSRAFVSAFYSTKNHRQRRSTSCKSDNLTWGPERVSGTLLSCVPFYTVREGIYGRHLWKIPPVDSLTSFRPASQHRTTTGHRSVTPDRPPQVTRTHEMPKWQSTTDLVV